MMLSEGQDRKSTRLNSSHRTISYAVFCLKKKKNERRGNCVARQFVDMHSIILVIFATQLYCCSSKRPGQRRHYYPIVYFFFNDTATTEIYTLSLHDALPI